MTTDSRSKFYGTNETLSDPGDQAEAITKDGTAFDICKYVYVGTGGDLKMKGAGDSTWRTWKNVPDGATLPFRAVAVHSDSTAADLLAIY